MAAKATKKKATTTRATAAAQASAFTDALAKPAPTKQSTKVTPATFFRDRNGHVQMSLGQGFDATDSDRTRRTRSSTDSGADRHMSAPTMTKLREMGRDYDRNSGMVSGVLDRFTSHTVGPKLVFEPTTTNDAWNKLAKAWFTDHIGPSSDARGMSSLRDNFAMTMRAMGTDGDQLKIFLKNFQIQTVEAHLIATPIGERAREISGDDRIVNGVRLNKQGAATGFWISKDANNGFITRMDNAKLIQTKNTLWPAYRKRTSQTRGVPVIASSLANYDRLDAYIDNEMLAAQIDACLTFWISRTQDFNDGMLAPGETEQVVGTADGTSTTEKLQSVKPGTIFDLNDNEEVNRIGGSRPGAQFEPFIIAGMRMFGASLGMPLELVLLDFSKTNYSSARAAILEAHKFVFEGWQQWLNDYLAVPIYRRWIFQAMALGELPFNAEWMNVKWFWPVYPYIDPLKSALAIRELIASGVHTITRELARNGITLEDHIAERKFEVEAFREAGIPTTTLEGATVKNGPDPFKVLAGELDDPDDNNTGNDSPDDGEDE